jgi:TPR repeat protein
MPSPTRRLFPLVSLLARLLAGGATLLAACASDPPGFSATQPQKIVCGCHDGATCYDATSALASRRGENADTAEELLYLAQCACFQESMAGCNTLGHFAKDHIAACERDEEVATSCTVAGFVHLHGMSVPRMSGRSHDHDYAAAHAAFGRACKAGAAAACRADISAPR